MDKIKVAKLIRLLATNIDGEALAALYALRRIINLNDLGDIIEFGVPKPKSRTDDLSDLSDEELVNFCVQQLDRLNDREYDFISGLPHRLERYGSLTDPQRTWVKDIFRRF